MDGDQKERPAELKAVGATPELAGKEAIGTFYCEGHLMVGESELHRVEVKRGVYHVWGEWEPEFDDATQMLVVHDDHVRDPEVLRRDFVEIGKFAIEGASVVAFDSVVESDATFQKELGYAVDEIVAGRGAKISLLGDGVGRAFVARYDSDVVVIRLEF